MPETRTAATGTRTAAVRGSAPSRPAAATKRQPSPARRLIVVAVLVAVAATCFLSLFVKGSFEFAIERRLILLGAITVAAFAQGVGTVVFQTVTHNRILTPSLMGFDAVYTLMQTLMVFVFGGSVLATTDGLPKLLTQTLLMVAFTTLLFRWLFSGPTGSLHVLLLAGVVLGIAFQSLSVFLQRLLSPADYDVLSTRLFGRLSTVEATHLPLAFAVCAVCAVVLWRRRHRLDVLLLGRDTARGLGLDHRRELTTALIVVAVLVSFSTALVGPMTFFGFTAALLAYQFAGTHQHAFVLPMAFLLGLLTLLTGQFVMEHVLYASGMLTVVIEFLGGAVFLTHLLRRGSL
ncbi:enterobactin ABC transporter permease [Streptomyces ruber]|uniref:Enterobactin ABC transporter permease n=2 Tax=Streptomyces TaxID=1883 RepID=A0A918EQB4_9ACTN|nr:iron chelate uptake ABC transporter family permease subunit [Streptomyces ruber]GGQ48745.1 enterobactin ABC transporter permease [Streptomyces ruber]